MVSASQKPGLARITLVAALSLVFFLGILFYHPAPAHAETEEFIKMMTFNLRYASNSKPNAWPDRRPLVRRCILEQDPDIFGTQEGLFHQLKNVDDDLPEHTWIGTGRDGGSRGEFMAIFYKPSRLEPMEFDHFWLSDTPKVIGSTTWGHSNRRMVTWVRFLDRKTKREFYFWNTHFDHRVQTAREKAAALINKRVANLKTALPVLLVGDFNASAGLNKAYDTLTKEGGFSDTFLTAQKRINEGWNTFNGFKSNKKGSRRIDWILAKGPVRTGKSEIVLFNGYSQYPSDHQPVTAEVWFE